MILFRTDGNSEIGTGHIMRCLSLADAFRALGEEAVFAAADETMKWLIEKRGFQCFVLGTDYRDMSSDLGHTLELVRKLNAELLIADSYFVTADYLRRVKEEVRLAYLDDLASFVYPVDVLINYNIYADKQVYEKLYAESGEPLPRLLLGAGYAPMRAEFRGLPKKEIKEKCTDILISTGGADSLHLSLRFAEYISAECRSDGLKYHLLIGAMNRDRSEIEQITSESENIVLHFNVEKMSELICSCDIAVSAAGSTMYEICACGVPLITYVLADNQIPGAKGFEKHGLAVFCNDARKEDICPLIFEKIKYLAADFSCRQWRRGVMQKMVDGYGSDRIAQSIQTWFTR